MILSLLYDTITNVSLCHNKCQNDVSIVSVITCIDLLVLWVYVIIHIFLQLMPAACGWWYVWLTVFYYYSTERDESSTNVSSSRHAFQIKTELWGKGWVTWPSCDRSVLQVKMVSGFIQLKPKGDPWSLEEREISRDEFLNDPRTMEAIREDFIKDYNILLALSIHGPM